MRHGYNTWQRTTVAGFRGGPASVRILITGSSGQLGSEIARQLQDEHETLGVDVVPGAWTSHVASVTAGGLIADLVREVDAVIHVASLHAPHVKERSKQEFVDINVSATLRLLEVAALAHIRRFVYTSTTSVYGFALVPQDRAIWVTEELVPRPRDIYDITKLTAEELCQHMALALGLPTICLRASRFFAEAPERVASYRLYRGADVRDIAAAHVLAVTNQDIQFDIFNISARSPFTEHDLPELVHDATSVIQRYFPDADREFKRRGWKLPRSIDRVYVIAKAEHSLGYQPRFNFAEALGDSPAIQA
jgi:UDP-glucose 4-epimerase